MNANQTFDDGPYVAASGYYQVGGCGLRTDGTLDCRCDAVNYAQFAKYVPSGTFSSLDEAVSGWCALDTSGAASCWTEGSAWTPPSGRYTQVSVSGYQFACGIRTTGGLDCWAYSGGPVSNEWGSGTPPE